MLLLNKPEELLVPKRDGVGTVGFAEVFFGYSLAVLFYTLTEVFFYCIKTGACLESVSILVSLIFVEESVLLID